MEVDISDRRDVDWLVAAAIGAFGRLDVLVNHAGGGDFRTVTETDDDSGAQLEANLTGPFLAGRAVVPHMIAAGTSVIVNTISICGLVGERPGAAYTAAKHGLVSHL